jgi:hypothetical protein
MVRKNVMNLRKLLGLKNTRVVCSQVEDKIEWQRHIFKGNTYFETEVGITPTPEELQEYRSGKYSSLKRTTNKYRT